MSAPKTEARISGLIYSYCTHLDAEWRIASRTILTSASIAANTRARKVTSQLLPTLP
jgi:hypothetical protein